MPHSSSSHILQNYLDNYFAGNLSESTPKWLDIFQPPLRCLVPFEGSQVSCSPLSPEFEQLPFDYPTFNPLMKMLRYRYFYAIQPRSLQSRWFDSIIKVDVQNSNGTSFCFDSLALSALTPVAGGHVVASWSAPDVYFTEADFVPKAGGAEDSGLLLSVLYNATSSESSLAVFDAESLQLRSQTPLGGVIPFHAHGIVCPNGRPCISNP